MITKHERMPSIRRRLLALLLLPALVVLVTGTLSDYITSVHPLRDAYDQALTDAALAIAAHIRADVHGRPTLELPKEAITVLRTDAVDAIYFKVTGPDGSLIAGDRDLPQADVSRSNPSHEDSTYNDHPVRLASYRSATSAGPVTTTVAETMGKRAHVGAQLLGSVLATDLLELIAILAVAWLGVSIALRPVLALREQIARRSAHSLQPLPLSAVPIEVRTLVEALNRLFGTIAESSRAQRRFLEDAAHQLRTPLTGVQAQLELLVDEEPAEPKRGRLVRTLEATRRLAHTTQQLLALARSENTANARADFRDVELAAIAESCVASRVDQAVAAGVDLGAELQPASVQGIAWLLAEAVSNLIDNAITHTPAGGAVTVRCGRDGAAAFLEVVDTGIGIPPEEREHVTSRFYRGKLARGAGSGLGLAIVADVARLHNARLTIGTGAGNIGTCVRLELDAIAAASRVLTTALRDSAPAHPGVSK